MATVYLESQGTELQRGDGGDPETFTLVSQITSIGGPDGSASEINITTLDSTAQEFAMGLSDEGSIAIEGVWDPDNGEHVGLRADKDGRVLRSFKIVCSDTPATQIAFTAFVLNFSLDFSADEVARFSATLRVSGAVTIT